MSLLGIFWVRSFALHCAKLFHGKESIRCVGIALVLLHSINWDCDWDWNWARDWAWAWAQIAYEGVSPIILGIIFPLTETKENHLCFGVVFVMAVSF